MADVDRPIGIDPTSLREVNERIDGLLARLDERRRGGLRAGIGPGRVHSH